MPRRPLDLSGLTTPPPPPPDTPARAGVTRTGRRAARRRISLLLPAGVVAALREHARREGLYLNDVVLAAWNAHVHEVAATPGPRRRHPDAAPLTLWYPADVTEGFHRVARENGVSVSRLVTGCLERHLGGAS